MFNRKTVRKQLASLLDASLTGAGNPAQEVFNHKITDFDEKSPVIVVTSRGIGREKITEVTPVQSEHLFWVYTFVILGVEEDSWTEADAEDLLDDLEYEIAQVIDDNDIEENYWDGIEYDGRSDVDDVLISGTIYKREAIPVRAWTYT